MPLLAEIGLNECSVYLPGKIALVMGNNPSSTPPPSNSPLPEWTHSGHYWSPSPPLPPQPWTFEQTLWINRYASLDDAKRLDTAKRILLHKIIESKPKVPNEI